MVNIYRFIMALFVSSFFTGCLSLTGAPVGLMLTDTKNPSIDTGLKSDENIVGRSNCYSILGLVALGDCSIEAAKKDGGISEVSSVDYEAFSVLGIYSSYTTVVRGIKNESKVSQKNE